MKRKHLSLAAVLAALLSFGLLPANAQSDAQVKNLRNAMSRVPVMELAPKAAEIVQKASEKDRTEIALAATRVILSKRPTLASTLVEAIALVAPETSGTVAVLAAELCPAQAEEIARIAASYAPEQASQIAAGVAKAAPKSAANVARRIVGAVPELSDKITEAVISSVPSSKAEIESDATLTVVSSIARNTRSSASQPVRKFIGKRPTPGKPPGTPAPAPTTNIKAEVRSSTVNTVVAQLQQTTTKPGVSLSQASDIVSAGIGAINSLTRDQTTDKQQKETAMTVTANAIDLVASSTTISGANRADAIKASAISVAQVVNSAVKDPTVSVADRTAVVASTTSVITTLAADTSTSSSAQKTEQLQASVGAIATVMSNSTISVADRRTFVTTATDIVQKVASETTLSAQAKTDLVKVATATVATVATDTKLDNIEKAAIVSFASTQITKVVADPTLTTSTGISAALQTVVNETKAVQEKAATLTPAQVQQEITQSETKVADAVKAYGTP